MSTFLEIEFKQLLSKEDYEQLVTELMTGVRPFFQVNEYISDEKGLLDKYRYSLRVRKLLHSYEFTLKKPDGFAKEEINQDITRSEYENLKNHQPVPGEIMTELEKIGLEAKDLFFDVRVGTWRYEREYERGTLCLDQSSYLDVVDYEIEYEAENEADGKVIFQKLLDPLHIHYIGNCPGKITRARIRKAAAFS